MANQNIQRVTVSPETWRAVREAGDDTNKVFAILNNAPIIVFAEPYSDPVAVPEVQSYTGLTVAQIPVLRDLETDHDDIPIIDAVEVVKRVSEGLPR
jgi:hypothetical protein